MELRNHLGTFNKQSIAVSSQVIQSIKILQFSHEELDDYVRDQVERNPLIDLAVVTHAALAKPARPVTHDRFGGTSAPSRPGQDAPNLEAYCEALPTLADHLTQLAALTFHNPVDRAIAAELIGSIEPDGYIRRRLDEIARRLSVSVARVEEVLLLVQSLDPCGLAARNLPECLAIQLREKDRLDPAMKVLLGNLKLLASYDFRQLSKLCGVDREDLIEMADEIKALEPRPGLRFDTSPTLPALPDVKVTRVANGSYRVELDSALLPRVLINRQYYAQVSKSQAAADRKFVADCMKTANWLVRNIDQRAKTVLKIATEVTLQQTEFLEKGVEYLRPLNLRDVALAVGVHESTVCRAISNKYVMTPRGLFELKYFFANSLGSIDGDPELSSETVRNKISAMVGAETASSVLSDEAIMAELRKSGVDIARRTIAKYRDILNIPPSLQRRRQKLVSLGA